jgi:hypothetical protein
MAGLSSFAVGLAAARALRNRTWAGARVLFEPLSPVEATEPTIAIWGVHSRSPIAGRALLEATNLRLCVELFLPVTVEASDGTTAWTLDLGASAAGAFAIFWRQCEIALQADQTVWADLFRALLINATAEVSGADLYENDKGAKIAARMWEIAGETLNEPQIGLDPVGVWADWLAAMRADGAELSSLADLYQSQIKGGSTLIDWQADFATLGLSQSYAPALGLAPDGDIRPFSWLVAIA